MKTFKQYVKKGINEAADDEDHLHRWARSEYERVAHDLPKHGHGHNSAAIDHVGDRMHDEFRKSHPHHIGKFGKIAKKALSRYFDKDEPRETRKNERKAARQLARRTKEPKVKEPKIKPSYGAKAGYKIEFDKPRKGVGSY